MGQINARLVHRTEKHPEGLVLNGKMGDLDAKIWLSIDGAENIYVEILIDNPDGSCFDLSVPLNWEKPIRYTPEKGIH